MTIELYYCTDSFADINKLFYNIQYCPLPIAKVNEHCAICVLHNVVKQTRLRLMSEY